MDLLEEANELLQGLMGVRQVVADVSTRTGVVSLDVALGGSLPSGAVEIYGPESVGKTSLLFDIISTAQHDDFAVALCASEYLDLPYMKKLGVDLDSLPIIVGNSGEAVLEAAARFVKDNQMSGHPCLVAIDSATGFRPEQDEFGHWLYMFMDFLEEVLPTLPAKSCIVMTNQVRVGTSIIPGKYFAGGTNSTAKKLSEMFDVRLELSRKEVTDYNYIMEINIVRNRDRQSSSIVEVPVIKGWGIDSMRDLLRLSVAVGAVEQMGSWYRCVVEGFQTSLGQGEVAAATILSEHPDIARQLVGEVMSRCR